MIDSGAGHCVPETAGQLVNNMKASGYRPEQVDTIFLTHLHLDHVCGLSDANGKALFPNATVYVPQEADYWLDPEASAPANAKEYFAIARKHCLSIKPPDILKPSFRQLRRSRKSRRPMPLAIRPAVPFIALRRGDGY